MNTILEFVELTKKRLSAFSSKIYSDRKTRFEGHDLALLCRYLSMLMSSGIRIDRSVNMIKRRFKKKSHIRVLKNIEENLADGDSISNAFIKSNGKFPSIFMEMLKVSDLTGETDKTLSYMAEHFEEQEKFKKDILMPLLYPIILFITIFAVVIILMKFVIPDFINMFEESGIDPPAITEKTFLISNFISSNIFLLLSILIAIISISFYFFKKDKYNLIVNRFLIELPIIGNIIININTVQFTKSLHIMFSSGIGLREAIEISYQNTKNQIYRNSYKKIVHELNNGKTFHNSLHEMKEFPEIFKMLIFIGEESGELEKSLKFSYEFINEELSNSLNRLLKISEPILIIFVSLIVVGVILTVFLPILDIYDNLG